MWRPNSASIQEFRMMLKKMTLKMKIRFASKAAPDIAASFQHPAETLPLTQLARYQRYPHDDCCSSQSDVIDEVNDVIKDVIDEGTFVSE
jgi:hypothetical protein